MATRLLIALTSVGALWVSSAQGAPAPSQGTFAFGSAARVFDVRSAAAWQLVQKRLGELGLATDQMDRVNQLALTKWRDVRAKGMEWLPKLSLPEGYTADRVRFEVFVSPFVEPARVYVGSVLEARKVGTVETNAIAYNVSGLNAALMAEIARAFGGDGVPIAEDREQRRQLSLAFLKDEADDCLRQASPRKGFTPPQKIPASVFDVLYPAEAAKEGKEGTVQVEFTILEDGAVTGVHLRNPPLGHQFEVSAMGAASLLRYSPAKLNGCGTVTNMTYTVRYHQR